LIWALHVVLDEEWPDVAIGPGEHAVPGMNTIKECDRRIHMEPNSSSTNRTPVLLVHGAFAGSWIWEGAFLDCLAKMGRSTVALDLRVETGEASEDKKTLPYGAVILREIERFDVPPIVIAHSLGALLAQRLLGRTKIAALVMLAPVPPEGMIFTTPFLFASEPSIWQGLFNFLCGRREDAFDGMADILFSKQTRETEIEKNAARMVFEGFGAVFEAHIPAPVVPAFIIGVPSLVVAGAEDKLISPLASVRTALYHGAEYRTEDELGHFMQTGPGARRAAEFIIDWLERKGL
jgi:pimeloyl-ACP methyl ester carboxylesterase